MRVPPAASPLALLASRVRPPSSLPPDWTPENRRYREFYGWDDNDGAWSVSYPESRGGGTPAVHRFAPAGAAESGAPPRGTLFLLHGYLEHSALRVPLAAEAVRAGWEVCGLDLPGHGLSSGPRADIADFDEYAQALRAAAASGPWPKPWRLAAHSTGCAATLLYIEKYGNPFEWVLFEAPLVRTFLWKPTIIAKNLLRGSLSTLPRRNAPLPKSRTFYRLLFRDPLYMDKVPIGWFDALERYEARTAAWGSFPGRFIILQGTDDTVVEASYNIPFLRRHLPGAELVSIPGGRHHLLRDEGPAGDLARAAVRSRW